MTTNTQTTTILVPAAGVVNPIALDALKRATTRCTVGMTMNLVDTLHALGLTGAAWQAEALYDRIADLEAAIEGHEDELEAAAEGNVGELVTCAAVSYEDGRADGYERGYNEGHKDGYDEGHKDGYDRAAA